MRLKISWRKYKVTRAHSDREKKYNALVSEWRTLYAPDILEQVYGKLYHYTTRENIWNIINTDSFYARHVRFSNDSAEYSLGKREVERCLKEVFEKNEGIKSKNTKLSELDDCYMVCFCKENDILSQWREYARGGVSLELYFNKDIIYTIKCNSEIEKENRDKHNLKTLSPYALPGRIFSRYYEDDIQYLKMYTAPILVKYVKEGDRQIWDCVNKIYNYVKAGERDQEAIHYYKQLLPYIKHTGFNEEKEARLIFTIPNSYTSGIIDYSDDAGIKKSYIRVQMGDAEKAQDTKCVIKYSNIPEELIQKVRNKMKGEGIAIPGREKERIKIEFEPETVERSYMEEKHFFIGNCKGQQYIFEVVDKYVSNYNIQNECNINIWCEGHLPIRKVTVGPSADAYELSESIRHRISNIYWLKYVKVEKSDIPYRFKK